MTLICQKNAHARIEESELAQAMLQRSVIELDHRECFSARQEGDFRTGLTIAVTDNGERRIGNTMGEADLMDLAPDA